jgi:hypothetical protein
LADRDHVLLFQLRPYWRPRDKTEFMPIAPGDSPTQCDEDMIRRKEVPCGGGSDNKFHLGSDFPLNFTDVGLAGVENA